VSSERYHWRMRFVGCSAVAVMSLLLAGCNGGDAGAKSEYDTGLKELKIKDTVVGTGRTAEKNDVAFVLYRGTFVKDGKQFDANMDDVESKVPLSFAIGAGGVIKGWEEGIIGMKEGGTRELDVPYKLAYGVAGRDKIPPKSDLHFEIKLLFVLKKGEEGVYDLNDNKVGTGAVAAKGDTVTIHYVGTYLTGKVWDDSRERGNPETFPLVVTDEAMPGLIAGIEGMKVGGKRTLVIPPQLAFGAAGTQAVEGNQPVKIVVDLLAVKGK
jgi:FKBP-type peptidyl-prolyl cis-trans isomerase